MGFINPELGNHVALFSAALGVPIGGPMSLSVSHVAASGRHPLTFAAFYDKLAAFHPVARP